ncbi:hypothetical protein [Pseudonocardia sp. WMMC193]|uniref:hypothetical protein n=1 Tax=Pseudonocardia sp. WMMC193 TaxID=2911965 RepID=UPI001F323368|nr:hypothetical protein [Pseudonocardia sp. WMMC193]MCF7552630.1 hypothetical protein [Pseudonocardia sp. WMMC193]MCF7553744.1 hypothetical protein [Pseudonocardia sp. WMMC193]
MSGTLHRGLAFLLATLLALVAGFCATTTATAGPAITSTGHHIVHDMHCDPAPPSDPTTVRSQAPSLVVSLPAPETAPSTGPRVRTGACTPEHDPGAASPGRSTLLAIGVDRN